MRTLPIVLICTLAFSVNALGQGTGKKLYRWTDEKGEVHYTDQLPPDAAKAAREELNKQGMAVDRVERAMTPEERAVWEAEQARLAEEARIAEEQAKMDSVLMTSYPAESDLVRAYEDRFEMVKRGLESAQVGIVSQEKSLADLLAHAAGLERAGQPVPETVVQSIAKTRQQVVEQRAVRTKREAERDLLQKEYERTLARYRELAKTAAESAAQPPAGG